MESPLSLRRLGVSDLHVSALGLGTWQFSKGKGFVGKFWPVLSQQDVLEIVKTSLEGGINWFDTAEVYGWGESERALASALASLGKTPDDVIIATKWWPILRSARSIRSSIGARLDCLRGYRIDLYQIHQPYSLSSIRAQMRAMAELVKTGQIRYVGVSNYSAQQMREAAAVLSEFGLRLVSNQVKYSLLDRRIERNGILATAKELGVSIIAYSPLEQGLLTGKFHKQPELVRHTAGLRKHQAKFQADGLRRTQPLIALLDELAAKYQATPAQIALNWLVTFHGDTVVAIPGASKVRQAEENTGALRFTLSTDDLRELDEVSHAVCSKR